MRVKRSSKVCEELSYYPSKVAKAAFEMYLSHPSKVLIGFALAMLVSRTMFGVGDWSSSLMNDSMLVCTDCLTNAKSSKKKKGLCDGYKGILYISDNIPSAATGTFFFQSIVDQLLYAKKNKLYPFIWMNYLKKSDPCFDPVVHGKAPNSSYTHPFGYIDSMHRYQEIRECKHDPTPPIYPMPGKVETAKIDLVGNGVWHSYFQPYPIPFDDPSCKKKVMFEFNYDQVFPGLHYCWDDGIRGWPFEFLPKALLPEGQGKTIQQWLSDHRMRASTVVKESFHLQPWLAKKVQAINPSKKGPCLAVHIRMTDKGHGRDKKGVDTYLPYIEAFLEKRGYKSDTIFLATDDSRVIDDLLEVSSKLDRSMFMMQPNTLQSDSKKSTFEQFKNEKHRLNTETLVDIYSMSKCSYLVHGYSAVAEAAVYINPSLDAHSVNIDDPQVMTADDFAELVGTSISTERALLYG